MLLEWIGNVFQKHKIKQKKPECSDLLPGPQDKRNLIGGISDKVTACGEWPSGEAEESRYALLQHKGYLTVVLF